MVCKEFTRTFYWLKTSAHYPVGYDLTVFSQPLVGTFNQERAFSVIDCETSIFVNLRLEL